MGSSTVEEKPPENQVFINFRGADLRNGFVSHLVTAFKNHKPKINVFIDAHEDRGEHLDILLKRIEESKIALAIFSMKYAESIWCVRELARIHDCIVEGTLTVLPIFYKVEPSTVRKLMGEFGDKFRALEKTGETPKWEKSFNEIPDRLGITVNDQSIESEIIKKIVEDVNKLLKKISLEGSQKTHVDLFENSKTVTFSRIEKHKTFGNEQRLKELAEKLDLTKYKETRIIGVVGMRGIGKTTLLKELFNIWKCKFSKHVFIDNIRDVPDVDLHWLPQQLLEKLLELKNPQIDDFNEPYKSYKGALQKCKVLLVLDDVSAKKQIDALLGKFDWIREGSRIVIATNDMSCIEDLVHDRYVVRQLNYKDSLLLFQHHAFGDNQANSKQEDFMKLSKEFVHYARGHPRALRKLGIELCGKNSKVWEQSLILARSLSSSIASVFQVSYDELTRKQQEIFLEIACFQSQDVDYVECLLTSSGPEADDAMSAVKVLRDKFLINTYDGRVEMHDLLYQFSRQLEHKASKCGSIQERMCFHQDMVQEGAIKTMNGANASAIFLDLSKVKGETSLDSDYFRNMRKLRYLNIYDSHCPNECKTDNKINIPDGLNLPLNEVRCLHWLKFPLDELPNDFNPINLVDLKLSFSKINQLWEGDKDTPVLKWVDLNHSTSLSTLSGLSKAQNLERLNLEGCTSLESLQDVNMSSLKTLILSGCKKINEFPLISENIEALYLDGTKISKLPEDVVNLQKLFLLNMKGCKKVKNIPASVGKLKALQKLVLSGCYKLKDFPDINESSLRILLLDGTSIKMMPQLPSVQYLCLSRNDHLSSLPAGINQLSQLTWLDLKYCTNLTYIPELPPNLRYFDAHGCSSLVTVAKPLACIMPTMQNHCIFNFTNCDNLEQAAKEEITSYAQRKCQLLSNARKHYNEGLSSETLFNTCFPGCEVPSWFGHEEGGSLLQRKLLPHWHDKSLSGIALCAVVSFPDGQDQMISVACTFTIKAEDKSWIPFTCLVGSWTKEGGEEDKKDEEDKKEKKDKIETDHVFIAYVSCPYTIRCLEDENSKKCNFTEASLEFTATGGTSVIGKFPVLRCGLSLVYAKDKDKNSSREADDLRVEVNSQDPQHEIMEKQRRVGNV